MTLSWGALSVSVDLVGDELPTECRLFTAGWNKSLNGDYLFDDEAANDVMAAFKAHAVDGMIDLEHLSLDDKAPNYDPDARGAFVLELRDGELWLARASWTPDGSRRLREKTQRYLSPAFPYDKTTRRVKWIHNVALTAQPALNGIPALVAARANLAAMSAGDPAMAETEAAPDNTKAIEQILKAVGMDPKMPAKVATALGLDAGASLDDISGAIAKFQAMAKKAEELLSGDPAKVDEPAAAPAATEAPATESASPVAAASNSKLLDAVEKLTARIAKQDAEAAALSAAKERSEFVASRKWPVELLDWVNDAATPLAEMQRLAVKANVPLTQAPVAGAAGEERGVRGAVDASGLDPRELQICKETGCAPEKFAALKAQREAARAGVRS